MRSKQQAVVAAFFVALALWTVAPVSAKEINVNARSAMLVDMATGQTLYEQNADIPIAPASITKVLTLYLVFEAIREGQLHLWDNVKVSSRAAQTGGSRMGLRTGDIVPVGELIKGMAVVSGNDACVAIAEHMNGSVEEFVRRMNRKARELGMNHTTFMTPNGLPAKGQLTTARDIATLSVAYLKRYPESLNIHSMQSYTYRTTTHRNANRLLGTCYGVDGLKTGFVCAAGYNLTATAVRADRRLVAVVLGAPSPGVRAAETAKLLNEGYDALGTGTTLVCAVDDSGPSSPAPASTSTLVRKSTRQRGESIRTVTASVPARSRDKGKATKVSSGKVAAQTVGSDSDRVVTTRAKSKVNVASVKGKSNQAVEVVNQKSQKAAGAGVADSPKNSSSGKAQVAAKGTATSKTAVDVKAAKAAAAKDSGQAKATAANQSSSSAKPDKAAATGKEKASPPPALRKISPVKKSS